MNDDIMARPRIAYLPFLAKLKREGDNTPSFNQLVVESINVMVIRSEVAFQLVFHSLVGVMNMILRVSGPIISVQS